MYLIYVFPASQFMLVNCPNSSGLPLGQERGQKTGIQILVFKLSLFRILLHPQLKPIKLGDGKKEKKEGRAGDPSFIFLNQ